MIESSCPVQRKCIIDHGVPKIAPTELKKCSSPVNHGQERGRNIKYAKKPKITTTDSLHIFK